MKFAFISAMYGPQWGGSEELWSQSAIQLKRAGHDVQASVAHWLRESPSAAALSKQGIRLEAQYPDFRITRTRRIWNKASLNLRRSRARLKHFNPDLVVISQGHNAGGFEWARICRESAIPYVMIVQCNSEIWWFGGQIDEAVASYTGARAVFCVSRGNLDLLRLQLGEPLPNAEVVRNPFNVSTEPAPPWPDQNVGWRLACVARISAAVKGQDLLLQTLALTEWRDRPVELNLFGDGPDQVALRRLAAMLRLNNVHFRGHVANVRAIWEENHLLVLPSRYEGLPLALVEAMWCGRPAVVTDVGGNAEVCVDGQTGFVAPATTLSSFSQAMQRAWDRRNEWPQLGHAARTLVENQIPKDPIALFCERLKGCGVAKSGEMHTGEMIVTDR
jgi:glycosyltransferase involved in cell wall biosynthesis